MQDTDQIRYIAASTDTSSNTDRPPDDNVRGSNTGARNAAAIAGGAAGGSLGALTVAALTWYFLRRRRIYLKTPAMAWKQDGYMKPELDPNPTVNRASEPLELDQSSIRNAAVVPSTPKYELPGEYQVVELSSSSRDLPSVELAAN